MLIQSHPSIRRTLTMMILYLPLGACTSSQLGPERLLDIAPPGGVLITVENQHVQDMRVYLLRGTASISLGSVRTLERRTFVLSSALVGHGGTVRLIADPLGSQQTFTSETIPAALGDHVTWSLAPSLRLSRFFVRRVAGG